MNRRIEFVTGLFVLAALVAVFYFALQIGGVRLGGGDSYELNARFTSVAGVREGTRVEIAGVPVGTVRSIELDEDFYVIIKIELPNEIQLDDDTIASIKTAGLIGDRYVNLLPGGSGISLEPGDLILDTEAPLDIEGLISRFAMGGMGESK